MTEQGGLKGRMRRVAAVAALVLCLGVWGARGAGEDGVVIAAAAGPDRLPPDVVELFRRLPIQDGGRIKPFDTFARFKLLRYQGKRHIAIGTPEASVRIDATEWLALTLLFPERALSLPTFVVDDSDVIIAVGGKPHPERRSLYSYNELMPLRESLFRLGQEYSAIEPARRTSREAQVVMLAENVSDYEYLSHQFDVLRERFDVSPDVFGFYTKESQRWTVSRLIGEMGPLRDAAMARENRPADADGAGDEVLAALAQMVHRVGYYIDSADTLHFFPPEAPGAEAWHSIGGLIGESVQPQETPGRSLVRLALLEAVMAARSDPVGLRAAMEAFQQEVVSAAVARGDYARVPLEVAFYRTNYFFWSLFFYLFSFLTIASGWLMAPRSGGAGSGHGWPALRLGGRWLLQYFPLILATTLLIAGIVVRCIIRQHPPVSTLYETILFIAAVGVVTAMVMELMTRQRIALAVAPIMGAMGMFLANRYEVKEAVDTMPSLVAVLRTNFWLATHVTTVTAGYAAGLLAGLLAHLYVLGRVVGFKRRDDAFYVALDRMVYGVLCFGLLFAFVGTMLGGIWANYSWGRFWGWDPKENGALMIVLWILAVLHARMGGYIEAFGTSIAAILGAAIVAFSWWGVNLLGVGLHSYGFTSGILGLLTLFWAIEGAVILVGSSGGCGEQRRYEDTAAECQSGRDENPGGGRWPARGREAAKVAALWAGGDPGQSGTLRGGGGDGAGWARPPCLRPLQAGVPAGPSSRLCRHGGSACA